MITIFHFVRKIDLEEKKKMKDMRLTIGFEERSLLDVITFDESWSTCDITKLS